MRLSLEIPTAYLPDWSPLCDLDFVLAHRVLGDDAYAGYFLSRKESRELILDNSMHELGHPLPPSDLEEAAKRVNADYVITPDVLGQPQQNYKWFKETHRLLGNRFKIAVVMCGRDPAERSTFLNNVHSADMLCLPYRENRLSWFHEHRAEIDRWTRLHLLGVNTLEELMQWDDFSFDLSVDTAKPIKWGLVKERLNVVKEIRHNPLSSLDLLGVRNLTCAQTESVLWNIAYLRTFLGGALA